MAYVVMCRECGREYPVASPRPVQEALCPRCRAASQRSNRD